MKLTEEERAILEPVERGEWKGVAQFAEEKERFETAAREGLPYQTLISSVLHKYINRGPRTEEFPGQAACNSW